MFLQVALTFALIGFGMPDRIENIRIHGNEKTQTSVVIQISELEVGDEITEKLLRTARERVSSSGLFEDVQVSRARGSREGFSFIDIHVKEKMSWFIVPSFRFAEDSLAGGAVFGESNLFGYNKKLVAFGDYGPSGRRGVVAYRDPSIMGTPLILGVDGIIRWDRMIEYEDRQEIRRSRLLEYGTTIMPGFRWSPRFTSSIGPYFRKVDQKLLSESEPLDRLQDDTFGKGFDIAIRVVFAYEDMLNRDGLIHGAKLNFETELSDNRFLSDFDYSSQELYLQTGVIFMGDYNWVNQASLKLGQSLPYYKEFTMGGINLRGYIRRQFRGDTRYSINEDLIYPIHNFKRFILRGSLFWDSAIIYFKDEKFQQDNWRNGVGSGILVYVKGVAIPVVSFDVGWGIEDRSYSTYLSVGGSF